MVATPGHTSDSTSLLVTGPAGRWLLTGDMVLGRGTTVITYPDGDLGAYLHSLEVLLDLVREHAVTAILPGHGPVVTDPEGVLTFYREHRRQRLDQVREALRHGDTTPAQVVARVYADVDRSVWPAAEQSVRAQLDYLRDALTRRLTARHLGAGARIVSTATPQCCTHAESVLCAQEVFRVRSGLSQTPG